MIDADVVSERKREYERFEAEISERQRTNSASFDKYVLTLSSSGLAISITAFAEDAAGSCALILVCSWICFFLTIAVALVAFLVSNKAMDYQLETARKYYIDLDDESFSRKNFLSSLNVYLNYSAGMLFLIAVVFLIVYSISRVI